MAIIGILLVGIAAFFFYLAFVHTLLVVLMYTRLYFKGGTVTAQPAFVKGALVALCVSLGTAAVWGIHALEALG